MFLEAEKRVPGSMAENTEQHHQLQGGFESMDTYFAQVKKDPSIYDGKKVREMIDSFGAVFYNHLYEEVDRLERSILVAIFPVETELQKIYKEQVEWVIKTSNKLILMPWVLIRFTLANLRFSVTMKGLMRLGSSHKRSLQ